MHRLKIYSKSCINFLFLGYVKCEHVYSNLIRDNITALRKTTTRKIDWKILLLACLWRRKQFHTLKQSATNQQNLCTWNRIEAEIQQTHTGKPTQGNIPKTNARKSIFITLYDVRIFLQSSSYLDEMGNEKYVEKY